MKINTNRLKYLRTELGLSQKDLSKLIGCSDKTIYNFEAGKSVPSSDLLVKLACALRTSCDYLLGIVNEHYDYIDFDSNTDYFRYDNYFNYNYFKSHDYFKCKDILLKSKSDNQVCEGYNYYWIYRYSNGIAGGKTQFESFIDNSGIYEIRVLRYVNVHNCIRDIGKQIIINTEEEAIAFELLGGQAFCREDICKKYLPYYCLNYIRDSRY